jgi:UDP-galactopyranose mutase
MYDYLIVGAGFAGCVLAERLAAGSNKTVAIVDKRPHIGGNAYDYIDEHGVLVHKYGPHIFHTNSETVFAYLSRFTDWTPYEHRVLAHVDGQLLPIPINLTTLEGVYGRAFTPESAQAHLDAMAEPRSHIATSEDIIVSKIGRELYEKFFRGYTIKQWGLDPSQLSATVAGRIPTRTTRDDRYFTDSFQCMPSGGYTKLFERVLSHPKITTHLASEFRDFQRDDYGDLIYTGPIDEYFNYRYGQLPYRSINFEFRNIQAKHFQRTGTINYPNEHEYTRITEFKYLTSQDCDTTTICYEYPTSDGDPYYPIPRPENHEVYERYRRLAEATPGVHFVGRLATYKYYNMDQVVAQALSTYADIANQLSR